MSIIAKQTNVSQHAPKRRQIGLSLIESLVSLLVLALGILGLAGVQTRLLVETRTANHRATAIGLIDDLTNRIALNRTAALAGNYNLVWGAAPTGAQNCTALCTGAQLAQSDLNLWRAAVGTALPGGLASVFASANDNRQIGIAISWTANESSKAIAASADDIAYNAPFLVAAASLNGTACPPNSICHIVYVQP